MSSPVQVNLVPERQSPQYNEGSSLAAQRITLLALSAIASVVSFTLLPFEGALLTSLGFITLFSLLSISSARNEEMNRPVRWYQWINPVRYIPRWNYWRATPVVHFTNTPVRHVHRPQPHSYHEVRRGVPLVQTGRVEARNQGRLIEIHPAAFVPPTRTAPTAYAPYPMPQNTPPLFERHPQPAVPAASVAGIPVRNPGDRVAVGSGAQRRSYREAAHPYHTPMPQIRSTFSAAPSMPSRAPAPNPTVSRVAVGGRRH